MGIVRRITSISDRTLGRVIKVGILLLVLGVPVFGFVYLRDQYVPSGTSLIDRQIADAEQAVRSQPNKIALRLNLAAAYLAAKWYDDALNRYDEILQVDRGEPQALLGRGDILVLQGKLDDAKAAYEALVAEAVGSSGGEFAAADPNLEHAYYGLGSVALKQHLPKDAVTDLEAAVKIDSSDADSWHLLGVANLEIGLPDKAVAASRQAILFIPTGWCEPYQTLHDAYQQLGDKPQAQYAGAMVAVCQKRPDDAKRQLEPLTSGPVAVDAMLGLGLIADSKSDRATAISWYTKVLAQDPGNFTATSGLAALGAPIPSPSPTANIPASAS